MSLIPYLDRAWALREKNGSLADREALRVYHGHTEGDVSVPKVAIEKFKDHYWVFEWENPGSPDLSDQDVTKIVEWLRSRGASSAVLLRRPAGDIPPESPDVVLGEPPAALAIQESKSIPAMYEIRFQKTRHPGLFLDHFPLRRWLYKNVDGKDMLNTFAYTGSLSVAAGKGGSAEVLTLDLSRPTIDWARKNWDLNHLGASGDFIFGDVFEWVPRIKKQGHVFDFVVLDPPSFSRTKKGTFSTSKDLPRLHALALDVLAPGGKLITSINSEKISADEFDRIVLRATHEAGRPLRRLEILRACQDTFPGATHLKGGIYAE